MEMKIILTSKEIHNFWLVHIQFTKSQVMYADNKAEHANKFGHYPLWHEVQFIDRDPHWYTRRVKEAIHIRLHPNNVNRDSGIEIPDGWMPTIKQHNSRSVPQWTREGTASSQNNEDRNSPWQSLIATARIEMHQSQTAMVLLVMRHSQSTSSPDEDQQ